MTISGTVRLGFLALVAMSAYAQTQPLVFQSAATQTPLLELYTSEGCRSCPPAEQWLTSLKQSPGLWKEFVPVAFHVDYWDYLGWRDPWASKAFSDRQHAYAALWRRTSVYTPGFVLNGIEWRERPLPKAGPRGIGARAGVLKVVSVDRKHWQVTYAPEGSVAGPFEGHGALLGNELVSDVKAGENRGRRLKHDFTVSALVSASMRTDTGVAWGQIALSGPARDRTGHLAVAFWITRAGRLEPLQALGGWLP